MSKWRRIPTHEDYLISSDGRVYSIRGGQYLKKCTGNRDKYFRISLYKNGAGKHRTIATLIMRAFIGPKPEGNDVNHINGIATDDRLENLEYCPHAENMAHALRMGLLKDNRGSKHWGSKLKEFQVLEIRELIQKGLKLIDIAKKFNVHHGTISDIKNGKKWRHVYV